MGIAPSDILLSERVAVVTGGGAGIGRGIAAGLKEFGANVAIWERDAETCAATAAELGVLGIVADVRDGTAVDAAGKIHSDLARGFIRAETVAYDDIVAHCCEAWNELMDQPWKIRSIGRRAWAHGC